MDFKDLAFKLFQRFIDDVGEVRAHVSYNYSYTYVVSEVVLGVTLP